MILSEASFGIKLVRSILGGLDSVIFNIFGMLIKVYFGLSEMKILSEGAVSALKSRVYIFVTVFMVFKIAISFLQAMVNPDLAHDRKAGLGPIITRIFTSLILLVFVPIAMDGILFGSTNGRSNQEIIASIVPKIILGPATSSVTDNSEVQDNIGQHIASSAFNAFFTVDEDCGEGEEYRLDNMKVTSIANHVNDVCEAEHKQKYFKYNYAFGVSTICGVVMVIMLLGYSLDIVSRLLKLQMLEVLAPIPIVSYIDPGKGKDNLFNTWLKTLVSTYCDFFIKLATLYFVIFLMVSFINNVGNIIPSEFNLVEKGYAIVIVIIGLLIALTQLPKFIYTIFGLKYEGISAGLGTLLGAAGGFATGGLLGAVSGAKAGLNEANSGKASIDTLNRGKQAGMKTPDGVHDNQRALEIQAARQERINNRQANRGRTLYTDDGDPITGANQVWDNQAHQMVANPNAGRHIGIADKLREVTGEHERQDYYAGLNNQAYNNYIRGQDADFYDSNGHVIHYQAQNDRFFDGINSVNTGGDNTAFVDSFMNRQTAAQVEAKADYDKWNGKKDKASQTIGQHRYKAGRR